MVNLCSRVVENTLGHLEENKCHCRGVYIGGELSGINSRREV